MSHESNAPGVHPPVRDVDPAAGAKPRASAEADIRADDAPDAPIVDGFRPLRLGPNGFIDSVGPLYGRLDDGKFVLGLRVEHRHCNPGMTCHGGMLMTLADMLLLIGTNVQPGLSQYLTTVNLATDFIRGVPMGAWIEGRCEVLRTARSLIFSQGMFTVDGEIVARVNGIFKPTGAPDTTLGPERYFR
jgi:uncharacterized protein (TIGR00369 family)